MNTEITEYTKTEAALAELRGKYQGVLYDVATTKGMTAAKTARAELRDLRVNLEKTRKEIKEPALRRCQLIDSEAKRITGELVALEGPIDEQIKAEESRKESERLAKIEADRARVSAILDRIAAIQNEPVSVAGKPSVIIRGRLERLRSAQPAEADFEEFHAEAVASHLNAISKLEAMLEQQIEIEAEQARLKAEREELDRLRKEQEERLAEEERKASEIRAQQEKIDRERREKEEAEHRAKLAEEAKLRAAEEAEERAKREADELERRKAEERELDARRAAAAAEERRLAEERARLAREKAEAERVARDKALAEVTLESAAHAAYELLLAEGYGDHIVVAKLARALGADVEQAAA